MKISNAARLMFWGVVIVATGFLVRAESGQKRSSMPNKRSAPPLRIVDQNGRPAVSGVPSGGQIFDVAVGQGGDVFCAGHGQHLSGRHGAVDLGQERPQCHQW